MDDGNECVGCVRKFERMTWVRRIEMDVMSSAACVGSSENAGDEEHSELQ